MRLYSSLQDPRGKIGGILLNYPSEPAMGGSMGERERRALILAFDESCDIRSGFNASREVAALEERFCLIYDVNYAIAVNGANTALDLVLKTLELNERDEVVVAGANFHGQQLSALATMARVVLAEIDDSFCMSPEKLENVLTENTKVVIATDLHGAPADYNGLRRVIDGKVRNSGKKPIIIADSSRSIGSPQGILSTKFCDVLVFSLQSKKLITAIGEGGVVLTNDERIAKKIRQYRSFGLGEGWGSNYKLSKLQAAVALVQLNKINDVVCARQEKAIARIKRLGSLESLIRPVVTDISSHTFLYFPMMLAEHLQNHRDAIIECLAKNYSIGTVVANPPCYQYNSWIRSKKLGRVKDSETLADRLICISFHHEYSRSDEDYICSSIEQAMEDVLDLRS